MAISTGSYAHGASATPLLNDTIGGRLDKAAERWPGREAVVVRDQGVRLTFAELRREVDGLAAGLIALGLRPGERVGIWSPNTIGWILTQYAAAKAGLILVSINPAYRAAELEYALNKVECRALIMADGFKTSDCVAMLRQLAPELGRCAPGALRAEKLPHLTIAIHLADTDEPGFYTFAEVQDLGGPAEQARVGELAALLQPDDPVSILFTSGTTGAPKAATLTHHQLLNNAFFAGQAMRLSEQDRYCMPLPLYHVGAMVLGGLVGLVWGATAVYPGGTFDPMATLATLQAERCTAFAAVPTMFIALLNHPAFGRYSLARLRKGFIGCSPCPAEIMRRIIDEMHMRDVTIVYGMTETVAASMQTLPDDTLERRIATVGRPHPHVEIKIVDPQGRTVPRGTQGEICARGYSVMLGYWNGEAETRQAIDHARWMHTGDLGVMDSDDFVTITGRSKDMVIRGGENIYPREVEECLHRHPAVADVHAFGVPDAYYGEQLCVWLKLKDGATATEHEIRAFCGDRIAPFKIPKFVRFVEAYPMTVTGKVQKFAMREMMAREFSVAAAMPDRAPPR